MQLFDLHCDSIVAYKEKGTDFLSRETQFSLNELKNFDRLCQTMAVFIPDQLRKEPAKEYFDLHVAYLRQLLEQQADLAEQALSAADIERITRDGKCACILSVESGAALAGKLENVKYLADCGVKMLTLVWNGENELGSGHDTDHGLTVFGKQVIAEMEAQKIIVDVSHLNDRGFEDLCEIATRPFIATHSNLRAVAGHRRNLTDAQFREIVKRKGLVGINLCQIFISDEGKGDVDHMYRHIDRMLELGGEHVIACGSDFDGADIEEGLNTPVKFAKAADYLLKKGISEQIVNKMYFENAMEFFRLNM